MTKQLHLIFNGPNIREEGVSLDDLQKTLRHMQTTVRLMVSHLAGYTKQGRPSWLQRESNLRLMGTSPGSLVAELGLAPSDGYNLMKGYGQRAIDHIIGSGSENARSLPENVADELFRIGTDLSPEITLVQLVDPLSGRQVEFRRREATAMRVAKNPLSDRTTEKALLYGWLKAVDWEERTAKLSRYQARPVNLLFTADYDRQMLRTAMQHVEVRGQGRFDSSDQWYSVQVEEIRATRSWNEPFDMDAFLNAPNPKIFRSDEVVRADEPFDVDEFIRVINEGRDV